MSTMQPQSKQVVIMMDHGNSLSQTQLHMAKSITKSLIASFSENDRVGSKKRHLICLFIFFKVHVLGLQ